MILVADENIPLAGEAFAPFGEVRLLPGREMTREHLGEADALVVRSVTKVNAELLEGTPVRFVGTATIGTDHLDKAYLKERGILWNSAAGCNARSVVEWVLAALVEYCLAVRLDWKDMTLGIVGHGNIGSRLAPVARELGMRVLVNDPPLADSGQLDESASLETVLRESDAVTLHVPYTREEPHPTHHLIGWNELELMKPHSALLNSSRGAVLDNEAAFTFTKADMLLFLLDVFENEPAPMRDLVKFSLISTPHIAGYSFEGKVNGTRMMAEALGIFFESPSTWLPPLGPPADNEIEVSSRKPMYALREAMARSYNIRLDNNDLKEGLALEEDADWARHFDSLRKNYRQRREFANYRVNKTGDERLDSSLAAMGFQLI